MVSKALQNDVKAFIDMHYKFKCDSNYKGFFGRLRALVDRSEYEQLDHYSPKDLSSVVPEPSGIADTWRRLHGSDPQGEEQRNEDERRIREIESKNDILRKEALTKFLTEESFSATLMKLIDSKGKDAVDLYKRANIDRKLFSKIRIDNGYMPSKRTAVALAIALELTLDETNDLLGRAGFALSKSLLFDVIVEYFITQSKYDIYEINDVLFTYKQPILGE